MNIAVGDSLSRGRPSKKEVVRRSLGVKKTL